MTDMIDISGELVAQLNDATFNLFSSLDALETAAN